MDDGFAARSALSVNGPEILDDMDSLKARLPPAAIDTERLHLRCWRPEDAGVLLPVLEANVAHLHWIPARVAGPVALDELAERLAGFAADFAAARCWRFGIFPRGQRSVAGGISMFPRNATARVPFDAADRVEIGYWLAANVTGRGYATEAARGVLSWAVEAGAFLHAEIRCDPRNAPSGAVAARLGFRQTEPAAAGATDGGTSTASQLWVHAFDSGGD